MLDILTSIGNFFVTVVSSLWWMITEYFPTGVAAITATVGYLPEFLGGLFFASFSTMIIMAVFRLL